MHPLFYYVEPVLNLYKVCTKTKMSSALVTLKLAHSFMKEKIF